MFLGDKMNKYIKLTIALLAITGVTINIITSAVEEPFSLFRGLWLFRYFTLQSNFLVFGYFIYMFVTGKSNKYILGITVYITFTFIVFAIMLSSTYHPTGWNQVANVLSHYMVPIMVILYFFILNEEKTFQYKDILMNMIYPLGYIVFMVVHGMITGDYLYPFFQVNNVGILGLIITIFILVLFFIGLSIMYMKIVSLLENRNQEKPLY